MSITRHSVTFRSALQRFSNHSLDSRYVNRYDISYLYLKCIHIDIEYCSSTLLSSVLKYHIASLFYKLSCINLHYNVKFYNELKCYVSVFSISMTETLLLLLFLLLLLLLVVVVVVFFNATFTICRYQITFLFDTQIILPLY
jgi:hypothetical protein